MKLIHGILLACLSAVILNTGMVLQKQAVNELEIFIKQPSLQSSWNAKIWFTGTFMTFFAYIFFFLAVETVPTLTVQSILASGVLVVAVISIVFLDERLEKIELLGLLLTVSGVLLLGTFLQPVVEEKIDWNWLLLLFILGITGLAALVGYNRLILKKKLLKQGGVIAGLCAGSSTVFAKILAIQAEPFLPYLGNPFFYAVLFMQIAALVVLQLTFKVERAVVAIPAYHSMSMVVPVIVGTLVFGEILLGWHLIAVMAIISGSFLLARIGASIYETVS